MVSTASSTSPFLRSSLSPHLLISGKGSPPSPSFVRFQSPHAAIATATESAERSRSSTCLFPPKLASRSCASFYEVLGIQMGASGHEIKAAYRKLARTCHPDVAAVDRKGSSADEFMKIQAAYSTLSDPEKRADYDREIFRRHRSYSSISSSPVTTMSRFSGYTPRNWETDQCW